MIWDAYVTGRRVKKREYNCVYPYLSFFYWSYTADISTTKEKKENIIINRARRKK